mgnify:CR=1 FL=1
MLEKALTLDQAITFALNGSDSLYADGLMMTITPTITWIPVGLVMLYVVIKNNELPRLLTITATLVACVALCTTLSEISKAVFERWRPSNDPVLMYTVNIVDGYRESGFGFFSAHAANTMSVAVFLALLFRNTRLSLLMLLWSLLNGWSRIYLGVHYFGDVIAGFAVGAAVGGTLYFLYRRIALRFANQTRVISSEYTRGGYLKADINFLTLSLLLTFSAITIIACVRCI